MGADANEEINQQQQEAVQTNNPYTRCVIHSSSRHNTEDCYTFKGMDLANKMQILREKRCCWSCLKVGHRLSNCRAKKCCGVDDCVKYHHALLHDSTQNEILHVKIDPSEKGKIREPVSGTIPFTDKKLDASNFCLLPLMEIHTIDKRVNVLFDSGATISLITFKRAKELQLPKGQREVLTVSKVGGTTEQVSTTIYSVPLIDTRNKTVYIQAYGIEKISTDIRKVDISKVLHLFPGSTYKNLTVPQGEVDILLGMNYAVFHPEKELSRGHIAIYRNRFGRCLAGTHPDLHHNGDPIINSVCILQVNPTIEDFFQIEEMGVSCNPKCGGCKCGKCPIGSKEYTIKEERELALIESGLKHKGDHWEATYPWIKDPHFLPDNKMIVFRMLQSLEKQLLKDPSLAEMYKEQIKDMLQRKVAKKLSPTEIKTYKGPIFYIPPHVVFKRESKSTPCRIVYNTSKRMFGHTLNEYWAKGPNLLTNQLGILIRFREERFAVTGDIRKMYHAIKIGILEQNTHRFLWRDLDVARQPDVHVITSVSFGDKPAGGIAIVALRKTAELGMERYPEAAKVIVMNSYVDDIIDSFEFYAKAIAITGVIDKLLEAGGFEIKEWIVSEDVSANDAESGIEAKEDRLIDVTLDGCTDKIDVEAKKDMLSYKREEHESKVLGLNWDRRKDILKFTFNLCFHSSKGYAKWKISENGMPEILTKRMILSTVNGIYDPLGLLTPVTVRAKILMKKLWCDHVELGWDDAVPEDVYNQWCKLFSDLRSIHEIEFKRCLKPVNAIGNPVMVVFCDASENAFGACCYMRWKMKSGEYVAQLMTSKSRGSPVKVKSIVRLEICGALIGKRLAEFVERETRYTIERMYFIVDSEIVRSMILKQSYGFNTFVAVRIGEIQEYSKPDRWYWVDSNLNVADWITRGKEAAEIGLNSIWQNGPSFLKMEESEWPIKSLQIIFQKKGGTHSFIQLV